MRSRSPELNCTCQRIDMNQWLVLLLNVLHDVTCTAQPPCRLAVPNSDNQVRFLHDGFPSFVEGAFARLVKRQHLSSGRSPQEMTELWKIRPRECALVTLAGQNDYKRYLELQQDCCEQLVGTFCEAYDSAGYLMVLYSGPKLLPNPRYGCGRPYPLMPRQTNHHQILFAFVSRR